MDGVTAKERLIEYGISPSVQRLAVMDYLLKNRTHPTADEIYMALSETIPTLSKTTVYNTLKLFVDNGVALMLTIDERNVHFDGDTSLHSHFLCKECGKLYDLPFTGRKPAKKKELSMGGHCIEEIHHYYKGICQHCQQKRQEEK